MARVLLADHHRITLKWIAQVLLDDPRTEVLATASECLGTLAKIQEFRPDVLVLDVHMPLEPGCLISDFAAQGARCGTKILGISFAYNDEAKVLATSMGAAELLDKVNLAKELVPAIMRLCSSEKRLSPAIHIK